MMSIPMQYQRLGRSGLGVSRICLGTMTLGDPLTREESIRLVHAALDLGINFIDTANCYEGIRRGDHTAGGLTEEILGEALLGRRDRVVLATKGGAPIGPGPQDRGLSAVHLLREIERSLERLQTDTIDLYIAHWPDPYTPYEETLRAIDIATAQGKIRCFGLSNHAAWQACEYLWAADKHGWPAVVSAQVPFSLLRRDYENDLLFYQAHDLAVTPYQPLQSGLLTGKYRRGQSLPAGSRALEKPEWIWKQDDALFDRLEALEKLAQSIGAGLAQYALAWLLQKQPVASVIVGAKRVEQLEEAVRALEVTIPAEHLPEIDRITPPPPRPTNRIRG